jgi:hypothetical protein
MAVGGGVEEPVAGALDPLLRVAVPLTLRRKAD